MKVGDKYRLRHIGRADWEKLAHQVGRTPLDTIEQVASLAARRRAHASDHQPARRAAHGAREALSGGVEGLTAWAAGRAVRRTAKTFSRTGKSLTRSPRFRHDRPVRDKITNPQGPQTEILPYGNTTSPAELGRAVRRRRREEGLTQAQAAGLCGVGTRFLSELERGKPTAEIGRVLRVLGGLGLLLLVVPRGAGSE